MVASIPSFIFITLGGRMPQYSKDPFQPVCPYSKQNKTKQQSIVEAMEKRFLKADADYSQLAHK
jgi:hypothetical protein